MRIVSLSPSLTEILSFFGVEGQLVGVTDACDVRRKGIERIGSPKMVCFSKIDQLSPDLVIADARDNRPEEIQTLQRKWKMQIFNVRSIQDVCDAAADLGRLVACRNEAKSLIESLRSELKEGPGSSQRERKRTILLLWNQPYLTVNFDAYPSRLLESAGGINVFREEPILEFPIEVEDMVEKNPQILLLAGDPSPFQKRHIAQFRQYRVLSKVPIHLIPGKYFSRYGVQTVEALQKLREIFHSLS